MKNIKKLREEYGAGQEGTDELKKKYQDETPGQTGETDDICEAASAALAAKAKKTGFSLSTLRKVYRRGVAAWNSGHRPGTTPQQWGMARVNSFVTKGKGTYHGADKDLRSSFENEPDKDLHEAESWEAGYERRVVKTTSADHKEQGYNWRIKGKERPEVTIKLYKEKPSQEEFNKQMRRVAGHEFGEQFTAEGAKDPESGLPQEYVSGLSSSTAKARAAHFAKADKLSDKDPEAYKPAPGDATAKTKESEHTKKYRAMFGESLDEATDYHAAALAASEHAKKQPSAATHKAASDAHEKAVSWHERKITSLIKNDGSADEIKKHEQNVKMHKSEAQKHRFNAHRLGKSSQQNEETTVTEAKWKVTFVHKHPGGDKKHDYVVSAPHQNAADKKAIEMHRKENPTGNFHMWNSEELYEQELKDACWKGYEAAGTKMKNGKRVPNCVPKEEAEASVKESTDDINLRITKHVAAAAKAGRAGDRQAQQWHLAKVANLKRQLGENLDEATKKGDVQKHIVTVTVSDPHHPMITQRKATIMKRVKVAAADTKEAEAKATAHYKKHGFKVHDAFHHSMVNEAADPGSDDGVEEIGMAKAQLNQICDMADELADSMDDMDELEAWAQDKISSAYDDLNEIYTYIVYGEGTDDEEQDYPDSDDSEEDDEEKKAIVKEQSDAEDSATIGADSIKRIQQLIRLGLLDQAEMPMIVRAMKRLNVGDVVASPAERAALYDLLEKLIGIITGDDMIFAKVRSGISRGTIGEGSISGNASAGRKSELKKYFRRGALGWHEPKQKGTPEHRAFMAGKAAASTKDKLTSK